MIYYKQVKTFTLYNNCNNCKNLISYYIKYYTLP